MQALLDKLLVYWKQIWHFFWNEDSAWSWIANIAVAFVLIKFVVYPLLGLILGTNYPIVAVLSESMEHDLYGNAICGQSYDRFPESFSNYWKQCGQWYEQRNITKEQFQDFPFKNGFYKGDVIILWRASPKNIKVGDVLVFWSSKPQPLIHRVVKIWTEDGKYYYQTKGDHNSNSIAGSLGETKIGEERVLGKGIIRIPYLGWLKIIFVESLKVVGINIER
jgi:signal peptidase I